MGNENQTGPRTLSIKISPRLHERLRLASIEWRVSISDLVRETLEECLPQSTMEERRVGAEHVAKLIQMGYREIAMRVACTGYLSESDYITLVTDTIQETNILDELGYYATDDGDGV
jgi:hypothetical protein